MKKISIFTCNSKKIYTLLANDYLKSSQAKYDALAKEYYENLKYDHFVKENIDSILLSQEHNKKEDFYAKLDTFIKENIDFILSSQDDDSLFSNMLHEICHSFAAQRESGFRLSSSSSNRNNNFEPVKELIVLERNFNTRAYLAKKRYMESHYTSSLPKELSAHSSARTKKSLTGEKRVRKASSGSEDYLEEPPRNRIAFVKKEIEEE